jgi:hypothetical protein
MAFVDQLFIGAAGFLSIVIIWIFIRRHEKNRGVFLFFYVLSFSLIISISALIVYYEWLILGNPFITIIASLIPITLSLGLVFQYFEKLKVVQVVFAISGGLLIIASYFMKVSWWQTAIYTIVIITFLELLILPVIASSQKKSKEGFWWVSVGGFMSLLLLGLMHLYVNQIQFYFLNVPVIFAILAPLFSLTSIAFFWGFMQDGEELVELQEKEEPLN